MAGLFPQVAIWEVGNEWNLNAFLHPDGFLDGDMKHPFTADEKMDIAVDLQYFSAKGGAKGKSECESGILFTGSEHADAWRRHARLSAGYVRGGVDTG